MNTPSILSAIKKLRELLTREEKIKWLGIVAFALTTSCLEVVTASVIVVFAQILNQPASGVKYLATLGFTQEISSGRIVLYFAMLVGAIYLIKNIIASIEVFFQNFTIQKMNYEFKNKLLHRYAEADYGFYLTRNSALGMSIVGGDSESIFSNGMISIASILSETIIFLFLTGMIIYINPGLAFIIFAVGAVLGIVVTKWLFPQFYRWGQRLQEAGLYSHQNLLQFFHGFKEIILLGKRDSFVDAYKYYSFKKSKVHAMQTATNNLPRMFIEVLFVGLFVTSIAVLCLEHESPEQMIGVLGGYLYVGFRLMPGLNRIVNQLNTIKSVIPSIERVYNEYNTVAAKENYVNVPDFEFKKSICFKNISFRYFNTEKDALNNISFEINKGESIGIVGETGSGKSTLIDVILGLLKPYAGSVLIDGKYPVNSYQWHKKIGYVPQSVYLIDDSIEANIAFGDNLADIDQIKLNKAINAAQLFKFIESLPNGVQTIVGERGIRLSGGERQRIAIARALYREPEILIFDEATSALDNETEARLMETIKAVSSVGEYTVIMVAHRVTTLKDCNRVVVMAGGVVKEITSYKSLSKLPMVRDIYA